MCADLSFIAKIPVYCISEIILSSCAALGSQVTDGRELRFASHQAADFLNRRLFHTEYMWIIAALTELWIRVATPNR